MYKLLFVSLALFVFSGCAQTSGVVKMGPDTYSVSAKASPARGGTSAAKENAINKANEHCASLGKEILVSNTSVNQTNNYGAGAADITFLCLDKDDPGLKRPIYKTAPDVVIENR